jgi:hypothetical protein
MASEAHRRAGSTPFPADRRSGRDRRAATATTIGVERRAGDRRETARHALVWQFRQRHV